MTALRAFSRSLARDRAHADDLLQEALLKAWSNRDRFEPGTNMRAWLFTILRNAFYSEHRKRRREVADPDARHARRLATRPRQDDAAAFEDFLSAFAELPAAQRRALALVGAGGMAYDEAADVCGVAAGTMKSRVSRARAQLAVDLDVEDGADLVTDRRMDAAVASAAHPAA